MRVFAEFIKSELSEEQLLPILRELLPVLIGILGTPEVSSLLRNFSVHLDNEWATAYRNIRL